MFSSYKLVTYDFNNMHDILVRYYNYDYLKTLENKQISQPSMWK
jgi:hypothetical protein